MKYPIISAVGAYLPEYILTNDELAQMVETNDEWITERTGIKERRILKGPRGTAFMAAKAAKDTLRKAQLSPEDVNLIICATVTPEFVFPATANLVADAIGAKNAWGYDIEAACSSFLFALSTGAQFIKTGMCENVLVIGADKMSALVNFQDRNTCVLFGDAAAAVLLQPSEAPLGILDAVLHSDGSGAKYLHQKAGGSRLTPSIKTVRNKLHHIHQEGRQVFKHAVLGMANVTQEIMERNQLTGNDIAYLVPHQANKRIIDATARRMNLTPDKVMLNIHKYGNTTSATIPLCLYEWEEQLQKGDKLILAAFGGGFTWGAIYLKWAYNTKK